MTEVTLRKELDLSSFLSAVQKLANEVTTTIEESSSQRERIIAAKEEQLRSQALLNGLSHLMGFSPRDFEYTGDAMSSIFLSRCINFNAYTC
jgi:hypothetical protein